MEQITWALTTLTLVLWTFLGWSLVRRPLPQPLSWGLWSRRFLWGALWLAALVGGSSGPEVWNGTRTDFPRTASAENPAETSVREIRTPFAIERLSRSVDHEGRTLRTDRHLVLRVPLGLLSFFAVVLVLSGRWVPGGRRASGAGAAMVLLATAAGACGEGGPDASSHQSRPAARVFAEGAWDTLAHIRVDASDTLLLVASSATADEPGFWVLDGAAKRVVHFDWNGRFRWQVGREGEGPGEFHTTQQAALDDAGNLWVLDPGNARMSAFDSNGSLVREVRLGQWDSLLPHAFMVEGDGSRFHTMFWGAGLRPAAIDGQGALIGVGDSILVAGAEGGMTLQGVIGRDRQTGEWVYALSMGDGMYRMRGTELVGERIPFIESVPFPGLIREVSRNGAVTSTVTRFARPRFAALDIAVQNDTILVGFRGETEDSGRLIDRYELGSGAYVDSLLLPRSGRVAVWQDRFVVTANDPTPEVLVLRWRS